MVRNDVEYHDDRDGENTLDYLELRIKALKRRSSDLKTESILLPYPDDSRYERSSSKVGVTGQLDISQFRDS